MKPVVSAGRAAAPPVWCRLGRPPGPVTSPSRPLPCTSRQRGRAPCAGKELRRQPSDESYSGSGSSERNGERRSQRSRRGTTRRAALAVSAVLDRASRSLERLKEAYFSWRRDSVSDAIALFGVLAAFVLAEAALRRTIIDDAAERAAPGGFWHDVYMVCQWVFGQQFPDGSAPAPQQAFAVLTAVLGLCVFALVLALVEQVVLEWMDAHVKRGANVCGSGHVLLLGWCVSQRDLEVVRKVLQQICAAYGPEGGTTVVVLTQRSKLDMEATFAHSIPEARRQGTRLVFRRGSPLVPADLRMVGCTRANATIVVSDQSRSAAEADAQAIRCAILLDELGAADAAHVKTDECPAAALTAAPDGGAALLRRLGRMHGPAAGVLSAQEAAAAPALNHALLGRQVVVELKTSGALPLLKYACGGKTIALPTGQLNAQRLVRMVKRPVVSILSQQLFNFENRVSLFVHFFPGLVGTRFGELAFRFPTAIVLGLVDRDSGRARMAPPPDARVAANEALIMCRAVDGNSHGLSPTRAPSPASLVALLGGSMDDPFLGWAAPSGPDGMAAAVAATGALQNNVVPAQGITARGDAPGIAWQPAATAASSAPLPAAVAAGLTAPQPFAAAGRRRPTVEVQYSSSNASRRSASARGSCKGRSPPLQVPVWLPWLHGQQAPPQGAARAEQRAAASPPAPSPSLLPCSATSEDAEVSSAPCCSPPDAMDARLLVPAEYVQVDDQSRVVLLVLGWGPHSLMADLIRELDHGLSALPHGSEVIFANAHTPADSLGAVLQVTALEGLVVRHVSVNPLHRTSLAAALDMAAINCAMVLCDELWVDPDQNDSNGVDSLDQPSVLRLDSLVMVAQLNVRKLLEDARLPPINIIAQKVATEGATRFEDRARLPLGVSVNFNSFAAKLLTQVATNPLMLYPASRLGEDARLEVVDARAYAAAGEAVNFWQLLARTQAAGDLLLGYYALPCSLDEPLNVVVAPQLDRRVPRVWNAGDGRVKLVVLRGVAPATANARAKSVLRVTNAPGTNGSADDQELEHTQRALWVAARERSSRSRQGTRCATPAATAQDTGSGDGSEWAEQLASGAAAAADDEGGSHGAMRG